MEKILFHANLANLDSKVLTELPEDEKISAITTCVWDVDFVAITGELECVLDDEGIAELLGSCSGKTLTCCSTQNVRCESFGRMLMFAKAGDWMIGEVYFNL